MAAPADYPGAPVTVVGAMHGGVPLRPTRWGLWDVVGAFVAQVVVVLLVGVGLGSLGLPPGVTVIAGTVSGWAVLVGWIALATGRRGNGIRVDLGVRLDRGDVRQGLVTGAIVVAVGFLVGILTLAVQGDLTSAAGEVLERLRGDTVAVVAFLIIVALVAPFVEELYVRGFMFAALRKRGVSTAWTVAITTVAFALMHVEPNRLPVILAMGLVLGIARARTGSTGVPIVAHTVNNALQVVVVVPALLW